MSVHGVCDGGGDVAGRCTCEAWGVGVVCGVGGDLDGGDLNAAADSACTGIALTGTAEADGGAVTRAGACGDATPGAADATAAAGSRGGTAGGAAAEGKGACVRPSAPGGALAFPPAFAGHCQPGVPGPDTASMLLIMQEALCARACLVGRLSHSSRPNSVGDAVAC